MRTTGGRRAALVAVYAAAIPALTALVVLSDLSPAGWEEVRAAAQSQAWALLLGLPLVVAGVWWLTTGGIHDIEQTARRIASSARTTATANPRHRAEVATSSAGLRDMGEALNALADKAEVARQTVDLRVAEARAELAAERDRLAAVLADLDHPVMVCTAGGLVQLLNDAARLVCSQAGFIGVGRSVFSVLDRDDLADPVDRAMRGERCVAPVRCGTQTIEFRVGPLVESGQHTGFVLVGPPDLGVDHRLLRELQQQGAAAHGPVDEVVPAPRPVVYDFHLLDFDSDVPGADEELGRIPFTVLDTETTGLDPAGGDRVVSVGAVRVHRAKVREDDVLDRLVDPRRPIPAIATSVHGITDEMVKGRSKLGEVMVDLARFAEDTVLVGYDIAFDLAFLRPEEQRSGSRLPPRVLDVLLLSAVLHPGHNENRGLDALAVRYDVPVLGRHTALGDALVTAEVFTRMLPELDAMGISTYGQAIKATSATRLARESARRF